MNRTISPCMPVEPLGLMSRMLGSDSQLGVGCEPQNPKGSVSAPPRPRSLTLQL